MKQFLNGWQFALCHGQLLFSTRAFHYKPFVYTSIILLTFSLSGSSFSITSALCASAAGLPRPVMYSTSCSSRPFSRHSNPNNWNNSTTVPRDLCFLRYLLRIEVLMCKLFAARCWLGDTSIPAPCISSISTKKRSEERRVGKECVSTCRSRCSQYH